MRRTLSLLLLAHALCAHGQSTMYSPDDATSSDFSIIPPFSGMGRFMDQSGLSVGFISGTTPWAAYNGGDLCGVLHSVLIEDEFWGSVDTALTEVHIVLDMGVELTWDRMAFFNEESDGFGIGSLLLEHGPTVSGPWTTVAWWWLTDHPGVADYGPDVLAFPMAVTSRYFRITGVPASGDGAATTELSIGEIVLGTAGADAVTGPCLLPISATGFANANSVGTPNITNADGDTWITVPENGTIASAMCTDPCGRRLSVAIERDRMKVAGLATGIYCYKLWTASGTTLSGRFMH